MTCAHGKLKQFCKRGFFGICAAHLLWDIGLMIAAFMAGRCGH